jgi:hypothetical protein
MGTEPSFDSFPGFTLNILNLSGYGCCNLIGIRRVFGYLLSGVFLQGIDQRLDGP